MARRKLEADAQRKAQEDAARRQADEEIKRKAAEDARQKAEADAQRKAQEDAARRQAEEEAKRKAADQQASAKPIGGAPGDLYQQAQAMEKEDRYRDAVRLYKQAASAGHGPSSKRLGEIYLKGAKGVTRDYAESVRWYDKARQQGMDIPK
jgi:TPR repeat protein